MEAGFAGGEAFEGEDEDKEEKGEDGEAFGCSGHDAVVGGEDGELVEAGYEVPASCDVAGDEDTKGED